MALVTKSTYYGSPADLNTLKNPDGPYTAGEALDAASPCYINSDGLVYMSNGTATNAAGAVHGWCPDAVAAGDPVTLYGPGAVFNYATSMTPGAILYTGATKGRLDTGATTGDTTGIAIAVSATHIKAIAYKAVGG
jgi:hypothetical protein